MNVDVSAVKDHLFGWNGVSDGSFEIVSVQVGDMKNSFSLELLS